MENLVLAYTVGILREGEGDSEGGVVLHLLLLNQSGTEQKKMVQFLNTAFWDLHDACQTAVTKRSIEYANYLKKRQAIQDAQDVAAILNLYPANSPHSVHTHRKQEVPMIPAYANKEQPDALVVSRSFDLYSDGLKATVRFLDEKSFSFVIANELVFGIFILLEKVVSDRQWQNNPAGNVH